MKKLLGLCATLIAGAALLVPSLKAEEAAPAPEVENAAVSVEETESEELNVSVSVDDAASAEAENVAVSVAEASEELNLADPAVAKEYVDGYADNVQNDKNFAENIEKALSTVRTDNAAYATFWSIFPPLLAIILALITKEVYSSLFIGIVAGGLIYSKFSFEGTIVHVFSDGFIASVADPYNIGILAFLVFLGALISMMNKTGGSAAFGRWTATHIKSRVGAQVCTILLGILIFVDDYFNCLTVGSVMRPVNDAKKVSRAKLAYLIDATAAPVCIIAPISSWAAAVAGFAQGAGAESGFSLFIYAIPYNFYAILTFVMLFFVAITRFDFGPMKKHEINAENGDIFTSGEFKAEDNFIVKNDKGRTCDLIVPVIFLIISCVIGMIYSGGFFDATSEGYKNFVTAFSNSDASVGLLYGSGFTIVFSVIFFLCRRVITFKNCMEALPEGFKAMVPAIMILCCAWTLKAMTDSLGAKIFVSQIINGPAASLTNFLPAIIFLIACILAFASGTSWGTFGILIPIVLVSIPGSDLLIIAVSACMAGAVCGDHCSPISDTTIMASAGAQCDHVNHVNTQLPYALLVASVSFVSYIIAAFVKSWMIALPISIVLMLVVLFILRACLGRKAS